MLTFQTNQNFVCQKRQKPPSRMQKKHQLRGFDICRIFQVHSYGAVHLHTGTANIQIFLENHYLYNKNDLRIHSCFDRQANSRKPAVRDRELLQEKADRCRPIHRGDDKRDERCRQEKARYITKEDEEGRYPYSLGNIQTGQTVAGGYVHSRQSDEEENPSNNREGRL